MARTIALANSAAAGSPPLARRRAATRVDHVALEQTPWCFLDHVAGHHNKGDARRLEFVEHAAQRFFACLLAGGDREVVGGTGLRP